MLETLTDVESQRFAELLTHFETSANIPSPPGVAEKILSLAEDPSSSINDFAEVVRVDAALASRLLQLANSPIYGLTREIYDVRHAITVLGLEATLSNALSIALVSSIHEQEVGGINFKQFWRRALASASANRLLARHIRAPVAEHYFMAGLLQDIGMIPLVGVDSQLYAGTGSGQGDHQALIAAESDRFGVDHALVSGWLLHEWKLPQRYSDAARASHMPADTIVPVDSRELAYCTAVSGSIADIVYGDDAVAAIRRALVLGSEYARLTPDVLAALLERLVSELSELGGLFDLDLGSGEWLEKQLEHSLAATASQAGAAGPKPD